MPAGRSGGTWRKLWATQRAKGMPCWLCGQPVDLALPKTDERSFSVDHYYPLVTHPHLAEDPANLRSAHLACNRQRGAQPPDALLTGKGQPSEDW